MCFIFVNAQKNHFKEMDHCCCICLNVIGILVGCFGAFLSFITMTSLMPVINSRGADMDPELLSAIKQTADISLAINFLNILTSLFLIVGSLTTIRCLLCPWLINSVLSWFAVIGWYVFALLNDTESYIPTMTHIATGFTVCLQLIMWYTIYSQYKELKMKEHDLQRQRKEEQACLLKS